MRTRKDDEVTLHILDMHEQGLNPAEIARVVGLPQRTVRRRIRDVREDDCAYDHNASTYWHNPRKEK